MSTDRHLRRPGSTPTARGRRRCRRREAEHDDTRRRTACMSARRPAADQLPGGFGSLPGAARALGGGARGGVASPGITATAVTGPRCPLATSGRRHRPAQLPGRQPVVRASSAGASASLAGEAQQLGAPVGAGSGRRWAGSRAAGGGSRSTRPRDASVATGRDRWGRAGAAPAPCRRRSRR